MPIFEYKCADCRQISEILVMGLSEPPACRYCNSTNMEKIFSAHASSSGPAKNRMPGPGDTACCGSSPGQAANCDGPGSCCGRSFS